MYLVFRHTMFRDEHNAWLMAKDSGSIFELLSLVRDEGKLPIYFILLRILSWFTIEPEAPKVLAITFAIGTVTCIMSSTHLRIVYRVALMFTFPFAFSYFVYVRDYALIIFLLALIIRFRLAQDPASRSSTTVDGVLMFSNLFGWFFALGQSASMILDIRSGDQQKRRQTYQALFVRCILLAGSAAFMANPQDVLANQMTYSKPAEELIGEAINKFNRMMFPIEANPLNVANIPSAISRFTLPVFALGVALLLLVAFHFWNVSRRLLLSLVVFSAAFFANMTFGYAYYWWHLATFQAVLFVLLDAGCGVDQSPTSRVWRRTTVRVGLGVIAVISMVGNFLGPGRTLLPTSTFSYSKKAAQEIFAACDDSCLVVVGDRDESVSIAGYLNHPVYDIQINKFRSHFAWSEAQQSEADWSEVALLEKDYKYTFYVSPEPVDVNELFGLDTFDNFRSFTGAIWENYWVYKKTNN